MVFSPRGPLPKGPLLVFQLNRFCHHHINDWIRGDYSNLLTPSFWKTDGRMAVKARQQPLLPGGEFKAVSGILSTGSYQFGAWTAKAAEYRSFSLGMMTGM
jgi:hypothetical protein